MGLEQSCTGIIGIGLVLFALTNGWRAIVEWRRYQLSENWVAVQGLITKSGVIDESTEENSCYAPLVRYTYQVMGQSYEGDLISFGSAGVTYGKRKKAEKVVARHLPGSQVLIHYDPDDPSKSVLEREYNKSNVFSSLLLGLGGAFLIYIAWTG
jgi:hypothetical protein